MRAIVVLMSAIVISSCGDSPEPSQQVTKSAVNSAPKPSAEKKLTCAHISDNTGFLAGGAWRIDEIVFSSDDFNKDTPTLSHATTINYTKSDGERVIVDESFARQYLVNPTHLIWEDENWTFNLDRRSATFSFGASFWGPERYKKAACEVTDATTARVF